jgi:hypothetical protein
MPNQLSLFPSVDAAEDNRSISDLDLNAIDEMFYAARRFRSSFEYFDLIHFLARFPRYSALNGLLLYLQNPNISHLATAGIWVRKYRRKLKYRARPLVILAPMSPIRFVYDIDDTEGEPLSPRDLESLDGKEDLSKEIYDKTIYNCSFHGILVQSFPASRIKPGLAVSLTYEIRNRFEELKSKPLAKYLIPVNPEASLKEKYASLVLGLGHLFCGHLGIDDTAWWPDKRDVESIQAGITAESVAYLVCLRKNLITPAKQFLSSYRNLECEMPLFGLNAVFNAIHYIEEMGKTRWKTPKRKSRYKPE